MAPASAVTGNSGGGVVALTPPGSALAGTADALPVSPRPQAVSTLKQSKSAVARYAERGWDIRVESRRETEDGNRSKANRVQPSYTCGREAGSFKAVPKSLTLTPCRPRKGCIFHPVHISVIPLTRLRSSARQWLRERTGIVWLVAAMVAVGCVPGRAWSQVAPPEQALPAPVGYVNDFANVLTPEASARIDDLARRVHAATRGDMVVVTLPSLGGRPVEEVSLRLGREWKIGAEAAIGDQARNAGVVILLVPKETSDDGRGYCRIETGQGTEGFITDAMSGAICREQTPRFRAQDYSGALERIATDVAGRYAANFGVALEGVPPPQLRRRGSQPQGIPPFLIVLALVVLFSVLRSAGGRRGCGGCIPIPIPGPSHHSGWSGGGFSGGGGFGGFGGGGGGFGGFGGGGGFSGGGGGSNW